MYKVNNNSSLDVSHISDILSHFMPYSQKKLGWNKPVSLFFQSDQENANKILGKTAQYDPDQLSITIFVDGRHPKDILRSLSHELVHHNQNCRGDLDHGDGPVEAGYAQKNPHLRKMELEAYEKGNIIFRDFEDLIKTGKISIKLSGEPKMSLKEWKNNELNGLLMKKWGLLAEKRFANDPKLDKDGDGVPKWADDDDDDPKEIDEGCPHEAPEGGEEIDISAPGMEVHVDDISQLEPEEAFGAGIAAARDAIDALMGTDVPPEEEEPLEEGGGAGHFERAEVEEEEAPPNPGQNVAGTKYQSAETPPSTPPVKNVAITKPRVRRVKESEQKTMLTIEETKILARKIFERLQKESK